MDITGPHGEGPFTVHELWVEEASEIDAEYYASIILDRSEKKLLTMLSTMGGMNVEEIADKDPDALVKRHVEPNEGFGPEQAGELAADAGVDEDVREKTGGDAGEALRRLQRARRDPDRGQPAGRHRRPRGRSRSTRRRRSTTPRSSATRTSPTSRTSSARGPAGADGEGEGPHLRQARRQHRHPRQRRRALHVHPRRRRAGRRRPRQLPRRRRRLQGRGDRRRARGDHLRREGGRDPLQHLRRHHPLRRGRQGDHRGLQPDRPEGPARGPPRRHQLRGGAGPARRRRPRRTCTSRRRCSAPPRRWSSSPEAEA